LTKYSNYTPFFLFEEAFKKLFVSEKRLSFSSKRMVFSAGERVLKYSLIVIVVVREFLL